MMEEQEKKQRLELVRKFNKKLERFNQAIEDLDKIRKLQNKVSRLDRELNNDLAELSNYGVNVERMDLPINENTFKQEAKN